MSKGDTVKTYFGVKRRYCTLCDYWYAAGTWRKHKSGTMHQICLTDRERMAAWYKANGYA
jgi:hypothetical protein